MASITWAGKTGNWATGADWIGGAAPGSADDATMSGSGTYTVSISSSDAAHSLMVNDHGATVTVDQGGSLTIGASLTVAAGTLMLDSGGTISGGVLDATGGSFQWNGGSVEGVTYDGTINLSSNTAFLTVSTGGLLVKGVNGTGAGTINLSGQGAELDFVGSQTFTAATIDIGAAANGSYLASVLYADPGGNSGKLTLETASVIDETNAYADIGGADTIIGDQNGTGSIINDGQINATYYAAGKGGYLFINPTSFTNGGQITVGNGSTLSIETTGDFVNASTGVITGNTGSTISIGDPLRSGIGDDGTYSNEGKIIATGATVDIYDQIGVGGSVIISKSALNFSYNMTTAQLDVFGGQTNQISITGTLNNSGAILLIGTGTALGTLGMDATIVGGTVKDMGSGWTPYSLSGAGGGIAFNGVTYDGTLDLSAGTAPTLIVEGNGLVVRGAGGVGNGTIDLNNSRSSSLTFDDSQVFDDATVNIDSSNGAIDIFQENTKDAKYSLTLEPNIVINFANLSGVGHAELAGGEIINDGTINVGAGSYQVRAVGSTMYLGSNDFTNEGTITVSNGYIASLNAGSDGHQTGGSDFTNLVDTVLTGGTYFVNTGSTLYLPNNTSIITENATLVLNGVGSVIEALNTNTNVETSIESTLTTIASGGALEILGARGYSTTNAILNEGKLQLGGGTFATGGLTDLPTSFLEGFGTISSVFSDSGAATAAGGALIFTGMGDIFAGSLGGTTIDFAGGTDLLKSGATLTAVTVGLNNGAAIMLGENVRFTGVLSQGAGTTFALGAYTLNLAGVGTTLAGTISGTGLLYFGGGSQIVENGVSLRVSKWTIANGALASINEALSFAGIFSSQAGATLTIAKSNTMAVTGVAAFSGGAIVDGGGTLSLMDGTLRGLAVGGTLTLVDAHLISQTSALTLGDSQGNAAAMSIEAGATYRIVGNFGIARGASVGSTLIDDGLLDRASGAGVSTIGVAVTDAGVIVVAAGTLDLTQAISGAGSIRIYAAGTFEADSTAASTLSLGFNAPGGTLALGDAAGFAARILKFAAGDTIDLINTAATNATLERGEKLVIMNGEQTVATLQLVGSFVGDTFSVVSDGKGGSAITVASADAQAAARLGQFAQAISALSPGRGALEAAHASAALSTMTVSTPTDRFQSKWT